MSKLLTHMMLCELSEVTRDYVQRVRAEKRGLDAARAAMPSRGYEEVQEDGNLTPDGREVVERYGRRWALRPEVHAERLAQRFEVARKRQSEKQTSESEAKETIAATTCPQMIEGKPCGGSLNRKGVCPSCVTGRMGYRYRYTCESCGCDIVTREELQ